MLRRRRHQGEQGQTLALAVAFLGFFGIFAAAVLGFAGQVQSQRNLTEKTATIDAVAQGSGQFAIADTGIQACGTVSSGTMKFASGATLSYTAGAGACQSSSSSAPGQNCGLCVLNIGNVGTPVNVHKGNWTTPGEADVNGSVDVTSMTAGVRIGLYGAGASCSGCVTPVVTLPSKVVDPLAGVLPVPTPGTAGSASGTICPGTYHDLNSTLTLDPWGTGPCPASSAPSLYIITGTIGGNHDIVANGSTLYLTKDAKFDFSGNGNTSIDCGGPPVPATCTPSTPTTGPYAGVAVFMDSANTSTLDFTGNGTFTVAGTFEASGATLSMGGNGGKQAFQTGRLIISQIIGNGNGGAGLSFGGTVTSASGCNYWNDDLSGTTSSGSSLAAHVRFETACNSGHPTSIIDFALGNGP